MRGAFRASLLLVAACSTAARPAAPAAPPPAQAPRPDDLQVADRAFDAGQWDRAAAAYDAALRGGATALRVYVRRAELYRRAGDVGAGLLFLSDAIDQRGWRAPELFDQRVALLAAAGRDSDAWNLARRVIAMGGRTYESAYLLCHQTRPAIESCRDFLARRPPRFADRDAMPLAAVALDLLAHGKAARALDRFEDLERRFADDDVAERNAVNGLCAAHAALRQLDDAIAACTRAADETDDNASAYYNLAVTYLAAGDADQVLGPAERYAAAVGGGGKSASLFARLAQVDARQGRWIECVFAWLRAQAPNLPPAPPPESIPAGDPATP